MQYQKFFETDEGVTVQDLKSLYDYALTLFPKLENKNYYKDVSTTSNAIVRKSTQGKGPSFSLTLYETSPMSAVIDFEHKIEISRRSLSDPRLRYQNTTAAYVKHKKVAMRKIVFSFKEGKKVLDSLKKKLDKAGILNLLT